MSGTAGGRLTVKEAADVAGVTPRTVRYYHSVGLLPEPPRDSSGYRRYGGRDVVALVRVARLRALGMPLADIAQRMGDVETGSASMTDALRKLADEIDAEIGRLADTRDRLRELADSEAFGQPVEALTRALQSQGVLGPTDRLRAGEGWAAAVLDALYPEGMTGVLAQASQLFADPAVLAAFGPLRRRLGQLGERSTDEEITALVDDMAALLPPASIHGRVDIALVDSLMADRLNPTQQRFVHRLRARLQDTR